MNRHGISQNPTAEESARLHELWRADDARARTQRLVAENRRLIEDRARLLAEIAAAKAALEPEEPR